MHANIRKSAITAIRAALVSMPLGTWRTEALEALDVLDDHPHNFDDVSAFHEKFSIMPSIPYPHLYPKDVWDFRRRFFIEELNEMNEAYLAGDLVGFFDAHLDLAYITFGSAVLAALPWQQGWRAVQEANMSKVRVESAADSKRGHAFDVKKPPHWIGPEVELRHLLKVHGARIMVKGE